MMRSSGSQRVRGPLPIYRALGAASALLFLAAAALGVYHSFVVSRRPPWISIAPNELVSDMLARGDFERAAAELELALRLHPERRDRAAMLAALGRALSETGRGEEAAQRYAEALDAGYDNPELRILRIGELIELGRFGEAAGEYREILRLDPDDAEMRNNLGYTLERAGQAEAALAEYERAVALDAELVQASFNLGRVRLARGDAEGAVAALEQAARLRPQLSDAHALLGDALRALGRLEEADESYVRAVEVDPHRGDVRRKRSQVLLKLGRAGEAATELQVVARQYPEDVVLLNNVAWLLATHPDPQVRSPGDALLLAERVVTLDPAASSLDTLAAAHAAGGDFEAAVEVASRALERARRRGDPALALSIEERLAGYAAERPVVDTGWSELTP